MERIHSIEDQMRMIVRYRLSDGRMVAFDERMVRELGLNECLRRSGLSEEINSDRLPVMQCGEMVGTLPASFDPSMMDTRSSLMYQPRAGDIRLEQGKWIACKTLGPGDLTMIVGFQSA